MNTLLIILGVVAIAVGVFSPSNTDVSSKPAPAPKSNDLRVALRYDGRFVIQTYCDWPQWVELGAKSCGYSSKEKAEEAMIDLRKPQYMALGDSR